MSKTCRDVLSTFDYKLFSPPSDHVRVRVDYVAGEGGTEEEGSSSGEETVKRVAHWKYEEFQQTCGDILDPGRTVICLFVCLFASQYRYATRTGSLTSTSDSVSPSIMELKLIVSYRYQIVHATVYYPHVH